MAPNLIDSDQFITETTAEPVQIISQKGTQPSPCIKSSVKLSKPPHRRLEPVWRNILIFAYLHVATLYGIYYASTIAQWKTILYSYCVIVFASLGVTAGAHRLWAHRTYKAKLPLRILLAFMQVVALQNHIYEWVRDHRVHHKFTDTDADPHNVKRGFFFSHMGWLMVKKHKDVILKGKTIDLSDLEADPVVRIQKKYYVVLVPILCFILPALIPWYFWNENVKVCFYFVAFARYVINLHGAWLVNSAAHIWGMKPYDKTIKATDNRAVGFIAFGEGWHNYHHVFPWDYKAAELGNYRANLTTGFIDFMAWIGQAYDLKTASINMIKKRVNRTGDGSRVFDRVSRGDDEHHNIEDMIWGWGDKDMKDDDIKLVTIYSPNSS